MFLLGGGEGEDGRPALAACGWPASGFLHALLFLELSVVVMGTQAVRAPGDAWTVAPRPEPNPPEPEPILRDLHVPWTEEVPPEPVQISDHLDSEASEVPGSMDDPHLGAGFGAEAAVSNLPLGEIGVLEGSGSGGAGAGLGHPDGGQRCVLLGVARGMPASEGAVDRGLQWLAAHQEPDGHWDCGRHGGVAKGSHDVAVTGLSILAFLGAGYTEESQTGRDAERCAEAVRKGLAWLEARQSPDGAFSTNNYAHGMAALAAVGAFWMGGKRQGMAQRAVDRVVSQQKPCGGWDYGDKGDPARGRGDTSISTWQVMALQGAGLAGLEVPESATGGVLDYLRVVGRVGESQATGLAAYQMDGATRSRGGLGVTAMTMVCAQLLGYPEDSPFLAAGAALVRDAGPQVTDQMDLYYTYYGTVAMSRMGAEYLDPWNQGMCDPLVHHQVAGPGDGRGSWPPEIDQYGRDGGRVYTTAMACLCLEVCYRYPRSAGP